MQTLFSQGALALVLTIGALGYGVFLLVEAKRLQKVRRQFDHIIHVQGTRGKSTVTRLLGAVLREAGIPTFTKVTGTVAATIDLNGVERPVKRWGPANIREQGRIMHQAAKAKARVLVIECMAVNPDLAYISAARMLKADILVLTQGGVDHQEAGASTQTLAMTAVLPETGVVFCLPEHSPVLFEQIRKKGLTLNIVKYDAVVTGPDAHPENIALVEAVATRLGIEHKVIRSGMDKAAPDPGVVRLFPREKGIFINLFAVNDVAALTKWLERLEQAGHLICGSVSVVMANRGDRPLRALAQLKVIAALKPKQVWVAGPFQRLVARQLKTTTVTRFRTFATLPDAGCIIGIGNMHPYGFEALATFEEKARD